MREREEFVRGRVVSGEFLLEGPRRDIGRNILEVAGGRCLGQKPTSDGVKHA